MTVHGTTNDLTIFGEAERRRNTFIADLIKAGNPLIYRLESTLSSGPVLPDPSGEERMAGEFEKSDAHTT